MNIRNVIIYISIFMLLLLSNASLVQAQSSLGISPPYILNESLLPGSTFEQEFILSRSDPNVDATARIEPDFGKFDDWIEFDKGLEFIMPEGEQRVPLVATIKVPDDAEVGSYKGAARINLSTAEDDGQVKLLPGVRIDVNMEVVSNTVRDIKVNLADIPDFPEGDDLGLILKINNQGNDSDGPSRVELTITDLLDNPIADLESDEIPGAKAFSVEDVEVKIDNSIEQGDYFALVKVYDENEVIFSDQVVFNVFAGEGTNDDGGVLSGNLSIALIAIGLLVVALPLLYLFFIKRRKKDDKKRR